MPTTPTPAQVVLIHGLGRGTGSMLPLAWRLGRAGFATARLGYPSTRAGIAGSLAHVRAWLARFCEKTGEVDLVGHSLGGLIAAALVRGPEGLPVRRAVQLGAPNLGSPMADRLGGLALGRALCGPAMSELSAHDRRTPASERIAAIAGTAGLRALPLARPHDGAVSVRSAWSGAGHRAAVPVLHSLLPASARVAALVAEFLAHGRFGDAR